MLYALFVAMVIINTGRTTFRTTILYKVDIGKINEMSLRQKLIVYCAARFCFLLFNSVQNFLIFFTIVKV